MRTMITVSIVIAGLLAIDGEAHAKRWFGPGAGGPGMGGPGRCGRMLMRMHPQELKAKLNLDDKQLERVQAIRNNLNNKQIDLGAKIAKQALKLRQLMEAELPVQNKVLAEMRKLRHAHGVLAEERVKAFIAFLNVLNAEQRKQMRTACPMGGPRHGDRWQHRARKHGRGGGPGPRGPGGGGPGF